jgi:hypothetical protein
MKEEKTRTKKYKCSSLSIMPVNAEEKKERGI